MTGRGGIFLIGALLLFLLFFGNVSMGAAGMSAPLDDVNEMLTLFASAILFVAGVLLREAAAKSEHDKE